jgi:hypothetical protein
MHTEKQPLLVSQADIAHVRAQAGNLLSQCLAEGSPDPFETVISRLVIAGPQSLGAFLEIMGETGRRKSQLYEDMRLVFAGFEQNLRSYGINLNNWQSASALARLTPGRFLSILNQQQIEDQDVRSNCVKMLRETRSIIKDLNAHVRTILDIEEDLNDWMWAIFYESFRYREDSPPPRWVL